MLDWSKPLQFRKATHTIVSAFAEPSGRYHIITKDISGYYGYTKVSRDGSSANGHNWDVINKVEKVKLNIIFNHGGYPFIVTDEALISRRVNPNIKVVTIEVEVPQ